MQMKSPRQLARARQSLPRPQVVAENSQNNLRHQLFAQRYRALMCKPKLHRASILTPAAISRQRCLSQSFTVTIRRFSCPLNIVCRISSAITFPDCPLRSNPVIPSTARDLFFFFDPALQ
jgi:hypothetical protein